MPGKSVLIIDRNMYFLQEVYYFPKFSHEPGGIYNHGIRCVIKPVLLNVFNTKELINLSLF